MTRSLMRVAVCASLVLMVASASACKAGGDAPAHSAGKSVSVSASSAAAASPRPTAAPAPSAKIQRLAGHGVQAFKTTKKIVALTFDDGPSKNTGRLIQILNQAHVHATFFWIASKMDTATAVYATSQGEEIGSHNYYHGALAGNDLATDLASVRQADDTITSMTGTRPFWFRSPHNRIDAKGRAALAQTGHGLVHWGVNPQDYLKGRRPAQIAAYVLKNVRPGSFVQLHDTVDATMEALPSILAGLRKRGYEIVTLSELASASSGYVAW